MSDFKCPNCRNKLSENGISPKPHALSCRNKVCALFQAAYWDAVGNFNAFDKDGSFWQRYNSIDIHNQTTWINCGVYAVGSLARKTERNALNQRGFRKFVMHHKRLSWWDRVCLILDIGRSQCTEGSRSWIIVDDGNFFEGTAENFEDCFGNVGNIKSWCEDQGMRVDFAVDRFSPPHKRVWYRGSGQPISECGLINSSEHGQLHIEQIWVNRVGHLIWLKCGNNEIAINPHQVEIVRWPNDFDSDSLISDSESLEASVC